MKFTVGTNWQDDLISKIKKDSVKEVYGKLAWDFVGGGRPAYISADPSKEKVCSYIKQAHQNGMEFNYLLSAVCLGNKEFTTFGQKKIHQLLDWVVSIGVDSVTVSIPYLLQLIKKQYPQLKVHISSFANVNTIERAKYWEDLGAARITLDEFTLNRDFKLLRKIRNSLGCELQLIANNGCLYNCPFVDYHYTSLSHNSQLQPTFDFCVLNCKYLRITNPVNFIRAGWIRPEDICFYEDIGIDSMILATEDISTEKILLIVDAYSKRQYVGNLMDLLFINYCYGFKDIAQQAPVYIDNQALDGFIEHFIKNDCHLMACHECGYCQEITKQVVKVDPNYREKITDEYKVILDSLINLPRGL